MAHFQVDRYLSGSGGKLVLQLDANQQDRELVAAIMKALGSVTRINILNYLNRRTSSVNEIAMALNLPLSTTTQHIHVLEGAGLIHSRLLPSNRGRKKVCERRYDALFVRLLDD